MTDIEMIEYMSRSSICCGQSHILGYQLECYHRTIGNISWIMEGERIDSRRTYHAITH